MDGAFVICEARDALSGKVIQAAIARAGKPDMSAFRDCLAFTNKASVRCVVNWCEAVGGHKRRPLAAVLGDDGKLLRIFGAPYGNHHHRRS